MNEKTKNLVKLILIFLIYFIYTTLVSSILNLFGISDDIVVIFIADLLFFLGIIIVYKNDLSEGIKAFKTNYSIKKKIILVLKWFAILFVVNMLGGIITEMIFPNLVSDGNSSSITSLASVSTIYTVFKTLVFATVAEELLFKKTIRSVISNKWVFIITSSLIYAIVNVMYTEFTSLTIIDMISYFLFSAILSYVYVKNDDNIIIPMIIKLFYNLIPVTIILLGTIA